MSSNTVSNELTSKNLAVWEEALLQEFIYAIAHLNHVEQHLLESDSHLGSPLFGDLVDIFREQRKLVGQVMFLIEKLDAMKSGAADLRSSWESIWCALKHATTALIHIDECIEKLLKRVREEGRADYVDCVKILLKVRENVLKNIVEMLRRSKTINNILSEVSVRCREDLCLEEVTKQ